MHDAVRSEVESGNPGIDELLGAGGEVESASSDSKKKQKHRKRGLGTKRNKGIRGQAKGTPAFFDPLFKR